jgi:hypothetical protein
VPSGGGPRGYVGVQSASNPDPFYYRPDLDAPRHPNLLAAAAVALRSDGLGAPAHHVLGDHDVLVAGEIVPTPLTQALAVGDRAVWDLPQGLTLPPGARGGGGASPDCPPAPGLVDSFLRQALAGPTVTVPADAGRRELSVTEVVARLSGSSGAGEASQRTRARLDYAVDLGTQLRLIVLDLARRGGGSGGLVVAGQTAWLEDQLASAGERWVIVVSHQPLESSAGGDIPLAALDGSPRVIAAISGHTHRNRIRPRLTAAGGYWLISTASLIDYPQQARALRIVATSKGVAIQTWMLDHALPGPLGTIARELSYIDAQGGRPNGFGGTRLDRNVILHRHRTA